MTGFGLVVLHGLVRRAYPWLPYSAFTGSTLVGPDGKAVIVQADGTVAPWPPDGRRSIASEPSATRTKRRR